MGSDLLSRAHQLLQRRPRYAVIPDRKRFAVRVFAFSLVQVDQLTEEHYDILQSLLTTGLACCDVEQVDDIIDGYYQQSKARCRSEFFKFFQNALQELEIEPFSNVIQLIYDAITYNYDLESVRFLLGVFIPRESDVHTDGVRLVQVIQEALREMDESHWNDCLRSFEDDYSSLIKPRQTLQNICDQMIIEMGRLQNFGLNKMQAAMTYFSNERIKFNVNSQDNRGNTLLHDAISKGDRKLLALLLAHGARMDIRNHAGKTPLEMEGADVLLTLVDKETRNNPLHWAVIHEQLESFYAFWEFAKHKGELEKTVSAVNKAGKNPLEVSGTAGNTIAHLIVGQVLKDEAAHGQLTSQMMVRVSNEQFTGAKNSEGFTPNQVAALFEERKKSHVMKAFLMIIDYQEKKLKKYQVEDRQYKKLFLKLCLIKAERDNLVSFARFLSSNQLTRKLVETFRVLRDDQIVNKKRNAWHFWKKPGTRRRIEDALLKEERHYRDLIKQSGVMLGA